MRMEDGREGKLWLVCKVNKKFNKKIIKVKVQQHDIEILNIYATSTHTKINFKKETLLLIKTVDLPQQSDRGDFNIKFLSNRISLDLNDIIY